jgi:hypothetical protein
MEMKRLLQANPDRAVAVGLVVLGVVALIVGWFGISGTGLAAQQNPYLISGGLGGIALIAVGCTAWLSADLQDEWRRLDAVEDRLGELVGAANRPAPESPARRPAPKPRARATKAEAS